MSAPAAHNQIRQGGAVWPWPAYLASGVLQLADARPAVKPHLIVLHVAEALLGGVHELLAPRIRPLLRRPPLVHLAQACPAVLPGSVVCSIAVDDLCKREAKGIWGGSQ